MAASALVVVAVALAGTVVALNREPEVDTAGMLLNRPTQGALAGDRAFLNDVIDIWESQLTYADEARYRLYDDLRGAPHVIWAGDTPAGRAAVVVQQTYLHKDYWVHAEGVRTVKGLVAVDPEDGKLKLVATQSPMTDVPEAATYFRFGRLDRTMLFLDEGKPIYYSATATDGSANSFRPEWQRLRTHDGVALMSDQPDPEPGSVRYFIAYQGDQPPEVVNHNTRLLLGSASAGAYLDHQLGDPDYRLPIPNFFAWQDKWTLGKPITGVNTESLAFNASPRSKWQITAWTHDRVVFIQETMIIRHDSELDSQGSVLSVAVGGIGLDNVDTVGDTDHDLIDHDALLPIKYHIPYGDGWVVANKGKPLAYRTTPDGQWTDAGKDAALLPDNAIQVKVGEDVVTL
jgi:hypothetical protein